MKKSHKYWINSGFINCLLAVVLGAFAAHGLKSQLPESALSTFQTGVQYQFMHGIAIILCILLGMHLNSKLFNKSAALFMAGIVLFSGSLYLLSLRSIINGLPTSIIGPLTPLGGLCFIFGWMSLIYFTTKQTLHNE